MLEKCQLWIEMLEDLRLGLKLFYQDMKEDMTKLISKLLTKLSLDRLSLSKHLEMSFKNFPKHSSHELGMINGQRQKL